MGSHHFLFQLNQNVLHCVFSPPVSEHRKETRFNLISYILDTISWYTYSTKNISNEVRELTTPVSGLTQAMLIPVWNLTVGGLSGYSLPQKSFSWKIFPSYAVCYPFITKKNIFNLLKSQNPKAESKKFSLLC